MCIYCILDIYVYTMYTRLLNMYWIPKMHKNPTKPLEKLLVVINSLIDFWFDEGEIIYITVMGLVMEQVSKKIIKDNVMSLNKQQIKLLILFLIVILQLAIISSARFLLFLCGLIRFLFCEPLHFLFYEKKWTNRLKKEEENLVIFSGLSLIYIT